MTARHPRRFLCDHDGCQSFVDFGFPLGENAANGALLYLGWLITRHADDSARDRHHCPEHVA